MRLHDFGKMAATFVDSETLAAVRVLAREEARDLVAAWAPADLEPRHQQAVAYRVMPDALLFEVERVRVEPAALERPPRQVCAGCGETVNFGRFEPAGHGVLCVPCAAGAAYYADLREDAAAAPRAALEIHAPA